MAEIAMQDDELWDEFHRVVNMTSRELSDWLRTCSAGPDTEQLPERSGTPTGQQVLRILGKRPSPGCADSRTRRPSRPRCSKTVSRNCAHNRFARKLMSTLRFT